MNILIVFVAGVTVGWVADKLYRSFAGNGEATDDDIVAKEAGSEDVNDVMPKSLAKTAEDESVSSDIRDDLSQIKGVGPKLAAALDEIGIYNYRQLSSSPVDELLVRLKETGGRFTMTAISSIVERAKLAAEEH